jgi:WD40 repeat protein
MAKRLLAGTMVVAALGLLAPAALAKTQVFVGTTEEQFNQGHAEGIVWTSLGALRLGRALESLLAQTDGVDYVARMAEGPDGSVYAVTGGAGRIYRVKDGKTALWATLPDKFLFSVAVDKNGDLYVGSGGTEGHIWRVAPQAKGEPKADVFFEGHEKKGDVKYVWDLAWMKDGSLAAATGDGARLLKITRDRKSEVLIKAETDHFLCVMAAPDGTLYAGTDRDGLVYRWADKKAFILYDADEAEITALALDAAGNLYAAGSSGAAGRPGGEMPAAETPRPSPAPPGLIIVPGTSGESKEPSKEKPKESPAEAPKDAAKDKPASEPASPKPPEGEAKPPEKPAASPALAMAAKLGEAARASGAPPAKAPGKGGSSIYRITPEGIVTRIFEPRDPMVLALAVSDGKLLVGAGKNARVYEVALRPGEEEACIATLDPKQVMSLVAARDGRIIVGSAGPGRLYTLSKGYAKEGTFTTQVYDAGGSSRWGAVEWRGKTPDGAEVQMAARSGNSRDPDKGAWAEWSKPASKSPSRLDAPPARYVQFRVTMRSRGADSTPVLDQFEAPYARANEAPRVVSIAEVPSPAQQARAQAAARFREEMTKRAKPGPQPPSGSPPAPPPPDGAQPVRFFQWQAQDPNGDALRYELYFRGEGEPKWILLEKDLARPEYAWDTGTVADGWYELRVVAGDRLDNPADEAREGSKVSDPILVDNTAPVIEKLEVQVRAGGDAEVRFTARDALSRLTEAAWSVDSSTDSNTLVPTDGVFDGKQKEFRFTIHKLSPGPHRLAVRAADEAQNVAHGAQVLTIEK